MRQSHVQQHKKIHNIKQDIFTRIIIIMKANQENNIKNQDFIALINQEYNLVAEGKSADQLVKLIHNYELDPFLGKIEKTVGLIEKYAHSLLINGQYLDLSFLIARYESLLQNQTKGHQLLKKVADHGKREELKLMWENIQKYVNQITDKKIGQRITEAAIGNTLATLSKYYLNFKVQDWIKLTNISEKDVQLQAEIKGVYIQLKQKKTDENCLQNKLKELVYVASKMNQLE